jgi:hypothetical protein
MESAMSNLEVDNHRHPAGLLQAVYLIIRPIAANTDALDSV